MVKGGGSGLRPAIALDDGLRPAMADGKGF